MMNKKLWVCVFLFMPYVASAIESIRDTMHIDEVKVSAFRLNQHTNADKVDKIDSAFITRYANLDLSYLLAKTCLVTISSNGSYGSLSSVKIRGGAAANTAVLWNGMPINSLTTGSADISMLNVGAFDQVKVVYGASGANYGSGTMGGAIELNNVGSFKKGQSFETTMELGSFSNYRGRIAAKVSNSRVNYSGQFFSSTGKNDFTYVDDFDYGKPTKIITNAENKDFGTIHNLGLKLGNHYITSGIWYQQKNHNIPGTMGVGSSTSHQNQRDSSLKAVVSWKTLVRNFRFDASTGFIQDGLRYTNSGEQASNIGSKRSINSFYTKYYFPFLSLEAGVRYNYLLGDVYAYRELVVEQEGGVSLSAIYKRPIYQLSASLNQEWNTVTSPPLMYSLGSVIYVVPKVLNVRIKYSTHYRRPSFNDRYWKPGGNEDLLAEQGANFETGANYAFHLGKLPFSLDANYYLTNNTNMIQWVPPLKAENTNRVLAQGIETGFEMSYPLNKKSNLNLSGKYAYSQTTYNNPLANNYGDELAYKPNHLFRGGVEYYRPRWDININNAFQSQMYSNEGYSMKAITLTDVIMNYHLTVKGYGMNCYFRCENIFAYAYQTVYRYAMPGRTMSIGINLKL